MVRFYTTLYSLIAKVLIRKLIYLCEPKQSVANRPFVHRRLLRSASDRQIDAHSAATIEAVEYERNQGVFTDDELYLLNVHFPQGNSQNDIKDLYLAFLHVFLIAEPTDIVLVNMSFSINNIQYPFVYDPLIFEMSKTLMARNILVVMSAGNSQKDLNLLTQNDTRLGHINHLRQPIASSSFTKNESSIVVGGEGSNFGDIVDCYFAPLPQILLGSRIFGGSSVGAARLVGKVLQIQAKESSPLNTQALKQRLYAPNRI